MKLFNVNLNIKVARFGEEKLKYLGAKCHFLALELNGSSLLMNPIQERIYHTLNEILERIEDLEYRTSCIDKRIHTLSRDIEQDRKDRLFSALEASIEAKRNSHVQATPPPPPPPTQPPPVSKTKSTISKQPTTPAAKTTEPVAKTKVEQTKPQPEQKAKPTKSSTKEEKIQPPTKKKSPPPPPKEISEPSSVEDDTSIKEDESDDDILFGDVSSDLQFDE